MSKPPPGRGSGGGGGNGDDNLPEGPMNVCLDMTSLNNSSRFRGIGMYCLQLGRALVAALPRDGVELFFLVAGPGPAMRIVPAGERVVRGWLSGEFGPLFFHNIYYLLKHTVAWSRLTLADLDLYHSVEPKGTARPRGCTVLVTCHDLIPALSEHYETWLPRPARRAIERWRMTGIDHAIAISERTREDLLRVSGWDAARVSVVHHGVDVEVFRPQPGDDEARHVAAVVGPRPYLLYVGGYDERKQVPLLVQAYCDRVRELDQDLVLAGRISAAESRRLRALVPAAARERVRLVHYVDPALLPALYRQATAHVTASIYEGFGMTITEAFACGCPVVAAAASCIPEVAGGAALLVPPGDRGALGDALVRVGREGDLRARLRRLGLERGRHFTWARCAEETLAVYRKLVVSC